MLLHNMYRSIVLGLALVTLAAMLAEGPDNSRRVAFATYTIAPTTTVEKVDEPILQHNSFEIPAENQILSSMVVEAK